MSWFDVGRIKLYKPYLRKYDDIVWDFPYKMLGQRFFDEKYNYSKISFKLRSVYVSEDSRITREKFRKLYSTFFLRII